jgi:crotonobetainyl-CoA:carnitine CoA-transferase CaiB-like acyl-CoA transferase
MTNASRVHHRDFVDRAVEVAVGRLTVAEVTSRLGERGVLVAPVRSAGEATEDPQVAVLGLLDAEEGVQFARTPLAQFNTVPLTRAPTLGEHSVDSLCRLGIDPSRVERLIEQGVVDV